MYEYIIVNVKNEFNNIVSNNPKILNLLYNESYDEYYINLKLNIFNRINKEIIYLLFNEHMIYNEIEDSYCLKNELTNEIIVIKFEEYCIKVKETSDSFVFYMNICKKISGFYVIK